MKRSFVKALNWTGLIPPLFVLVAFLLLYLSGAPSVPIAYGDSDEMLSLGYFLGVGHPPGYPLYILLLHFFVHLPLPVSVAFKGHLMSALFHAGGLALVYLTVKELYRALPLKRKGGVLTNFEHEGIWLSLLTTFTLGASYLYWLYGQIAEKYALSVLLLSSFAYVLVRLHGMSLHKSETRYWWIGLFLLLGLSISHHQTLLVLLLPAAVFLYLKRFEVTLKHIGTALVPLVLGATVPFLLLLYYESQEPLISWSMEPTLNGLWAHISRQIFAGEALERGAQVSNFFTNFDIDAAITAVIEFFKLGIQYYYYWLVIPLIVGVRFGWEYAKEKFLLMAMLAFSLAVVLPGLLGWTDDLGSQAILQRQLIVAFIPLSLLSFYGWHELSLRLVNGFSVLIDRKRVIYAVVVLPFLLFGFQMYRVYPEVSRADFELPYRIYEGALAQAQDNSIVTCYSDPSCFSLLYQRFVEGKREDVTVFPLQYPLVVNAYDFSQLRGFLYPQNPFLMWDVVTWNLSKRPVHAVDMSQYYYQFFGFDYPFMYYVPDTHLGHLTRQLPEEIPAPTFEHAPLVLEQTGETMDLMKKWLTLHFAEVHILNGLQYLKMGERPFAQEELHHAANIYFAYGPAEESQITTLRNQFEQMRPREEVFEPGATVDSAQTYLDYIPDLLADEYNQRALLAAQGAVSIEPTNVEARLVLAELYEQMGDYQFASLEYSNVLVVDPENETARERLSTLQPANEQ